MTCKPAFAIRAEKTPVTNVYKITVGMVPTGQFMKAAEKLYLVPEDETGYKSEHTIIFTNDTKLTETYCFQLPAADNIFIYGKTKAQFYTWRGRLYVDIDGEINPTGTKSFENDSKLRRKLYNRLDAKRELRRKKEREERNRKKFMNK